MSERDLDCNFDICVVCGLGGNLVLCDSCPKVFHRLCVVDLVGDISGDIIVCHICKSANQCFTWNGPGFRNSSLNDYILASDDLVRNSALDLFANSEMKFNTIGLLLSYLEWNIPLASLRMVAGLTSTYFKTMNPIVVATTNCNGSTLSECVGTNSILSLNLASYLLQIEECVGSDVFNRINILLNNYKINGDIIYNGIATGLSTSIALLTQRCTLCGSVRYFRRFCYHCANIFNNEFWKCKYPFAGDVMGLEVSGKPKVRIPRRSLTASDDSTANVMDEELYYEASYTALCGMIN